jgi:uncharacterized protein YceK
MKIISTMLIFAVFMSGCASIFHGTTDTIYVRSNEPDTTFYANNREIGKGTTGVVIVHKKDLDNTQLRAEKMGCNTKSTPIESKFDATTLLGILIDWGIISILLIDWAINGAVERAAQTDFVLTPDCQKGSTPSQTPNPQGQQLPGQI